MLMAHLMQDVGNKWGFVLLLKIFHFFSIGVHIFLLKSKVTYLNIGIVQHTLKQRNKFSVKYSQTASIWCSEQMLRWEMGITLKYTVHFLYFISIHGLLRLFLYLDSFAHQVRYCVIDDCRKKWKMDLAW